jgi:hypothetical protein
MIIPCQPGFYLYVGSYCLVAITGFGLGIIYNHDDNDDATPVLSMFMLFVLLITRLYV